MRYEVWLNLHLGLLACLISRPQDQRGGFRFDAPYCSAWLVMHGEAWVEVEGVGSARALPGQWLICPTGWRTQRFPEDTELLSLAFHAFWLGGTPFFGPGLPVVLNATDHPRLQRAAQRLNRVIERCAPGHDFYMFKQEFSAEAFLNIQGYFPQFMMELVRALGRAGVNPTGVYQVDPRISKALNLIERFPLNEHFSVSEIARLCGLSRPHLDRLFHLQVGHSPKAQFDRRRLLRARHLLTDPSIQVQEVAFSLGFRSLSHFHRWFKEETGQSPRDYQKKHSGKMGAGDIR